MMQLVTQSEQEVTEEGRTFLGSGGKVQSRSLAPPKWQDFKAGHFQKYHRSISFLLPALPPFLPLLPFLFYSSSGVLMKSY